MASDSYRYRTGRMQRQLFSDRDDYLAKRSGPEVGWPQFCQAMEATVYAGFRDPEIGLPLNTGWVGFPWMTLVLGSGCLDLPEAADKTAAELAEQVFRTLTTVLGPSSPEPQRAAEFTWSLVNARIGSVDEESADARALPWAERIAQVAESADTSISKTVSEEESLAPRLVFVAALLTRSFHMACAGGNAALGRWGDDVALVLPQAGAELGPDVIPLALEQIRLIVRTLNRSRSALNQAVGTLLRSIDRNLTISIDRPARQLRLVHLRLLTEVSWHLLLGEKSIYPGWTDLLLRLMIGEGITDAAATRSRPGKMNLTQYGPAVKALLEIPTSVSWDDDASSHQETRGRSEFYRSAADVLCAQADAVVRSDRAAVDLPNVIDAALKVIAADGAEIDDDLRESIKTVADFAGLGDQLRREIEFLASKATHVDGAIRGHAAQVLQQARAAMDNLSTLPPASAFVTSFDVELEMALWKHTHRPFAVVMPVHVVDKPKRPADQEAELCWLLAVIEPTSVDGSEDVDSREPLLADVLRPIRWRLLTHHTNKTLLRDHPVIVHLSGCPMIDLPNLARVPGEDAPPANEELLDDLRLAGIDMAGRSFAHAVTVDEYLALRQAEAELFWSAVQGTDADHPDRSLYPSLVEDGAHNPRFWMAMGVPIADPAIRHRVVSQITQRMLRDVRQLAVRASAGGPEGSSDPDLDEWGDPDEPSGDGDANAASRESADDSGANSTGDEPAADRGGIDDRDALRSRGGIDGVAINKRIADNEAGLLYWIGLDVVRGDCSDFAEDLRHYTAHLRATPDHRRPLPGVLCTLPTPEPFVGAADDMQEAEG